MNPLQQIISNDIRKAGAIRFERFMELALYCPVYGYYEAEADKIGRSGDFYTSVSVGSLFGELLAFQFSKWLFEREASEPAAIVESGAHHGQLARDILCWIQTWRPSLFDRLVYCIVEPSSGQEARQRRCLKAFENRVTWVRQLEDLSEHGGRCEILFSNELLDAMPVRRMGWDGKLKCWFEWGVAMEGEQFVWRRLPADPGQIPDLPAAILELLPDGYTVELPTAAGDWWGRAAEVLKRGRLVGIDYGMISEELYTPERRDGTLRAYSKHHVSTELLARPGEQDITSHVNFSMIRKAGECAGLRTDLFETQARFLLRIAEETWNPNQAFGEWDERRRRQLKTLVHPEHLGRPFRVLVQSRGLAGASSS